MPSLLDVTDTLESKALELCQFVVDDADFAAAHDKIAQFLDDPQAQELYRAWQEKGSELHRMQHQGLSPSDKDLKEMDRLKQAAVNNDIVAEFAEAEAHLNGMFSTVTKLLQKTLQLGRIPAPEEMAESGCCGGGGGGGCGCN